MSLGKKIHLSQPATALCSNSWIIGVVSASGSRSSNIYCRQLRSPHRTRSPVLASRFSRISPLQNSHPKKTDSTHVSSTITLRKTHQAGHDQQRIQSEQTQKTRTDREGSHECPRRIRFCPIRNRQGKTGAQASGESFSHVPQRDHSSRA